MSIKNWGGRLALIGLWKLCSPLETAKYIPYNELRETDVKEEKSCEGKTIKGCSPAEPWGQTDTEEPKWKGRWGGGGDESHLKIWSDAHRSGTCQQPRYLYLTSLCSVLSVDLNALSYLDWILQKGTSIFPRCLYKSMTLMLKCFHMSWNDLLKPCWIKTCRCSLIRMSKNTWRLVTNIAPLWWLHIYISHNSHTRCQVVAL